MVYKFIYLFATHANKLADANTSGIAVTCACSETLATQNAFAMKE